MASKYIPSDEARVGACVTTTIPMIGYDMSDGTPRDLVAPGTIGRICKRNGLADRFFSAVVQWDTEPPMTTAMLSCGNGHLHDLVLCVADQGAADQGDARLSA